MILRRYLSQSQDNKKAAASQTGLRLPYCASYAQHMSSDSKIDEQG